MPSPIKSNAEFIPFRLEVLSPVHIGSGEALSPLECQVVNEDGKYFVYTVDYEAWMNSLQGEEALELADFFSRNSLTAVWEKVRSDLDREAFCLNKSATCENIYSSFTKRLRSETSKNELSPATRNPAHGNMIIPGSSLKGAISTAIIDSIDHGDLKAADQYRGGQNKLLEQWFGKISEHAFQALKVSDLALLPMQSHFVEGIERKLKDATKGAPKLSCEVAPKGTKLYGRLLMGRNVDKQNSAKLPLTPWTFENLRKVCNAFYRDRFMKEHGTFYMLPHFADTKKLSQSMWEYISANEDAILLRVGHYSHVECVTVKDHAPQTPKRKGVQMPFGKTRTHADGVWPFGWVLLHRCSMEEYEQGMVQYEQKKSTILDDLAHKRELYLQQSADRQRRRAEEFAERRRHEAEEEAKRQAFLAKVQADREAKRIAEEQAAAERERMAVEKEARQQAAAANKEAEEARLAALSPQERAIDCVLSGRADNTQVLQAYDQLDSYAEPVKLAEAIKKLWTKEGKWSGKKLKKGQPERVQKVKGFLAKA